MAQQGATLAGILTVGAVCAGRISGFFALASETVDSISAFSGFLFSTLAAVTAAAGAAAGPRNVSTAGPDPEDPRRMEKGQDAADARLCLCFFG